MRENWLDLAHCLYERREWQRCYDACERAVTITEIPDVYITDRNAYGPLAHDLMSIAAYHLGKRDIAR